MVVTDLLTVVSRAQVLSVHLPLTTETRDDVVLSPHVAGLTTAAQKRVVSAIAADVETVLAGGTPVNAVTTVRTAT